MRTDVYALGAMLFHMLTGGVPFPADTDEARLWAHLSEPPPAPSRAGGGIPVAFDAVIARAMAKDPAAPLRERRRPQPRRARRGRASRPRRRPPRRPTTGARSPARALADPFSLAAAGAIVLAGRDLRRPRPRPAAGPRRLPRGRRRGPTSTTTCARPCARRSSRRARAAGDGLAEEIQLLLRQAAQTRRARPRRDRASPTCPTPRSPPRSTGSWRPCTRPPRAPSDCTRGCATPRRTRSRRGSSG